MNTLSKIKPNSYRQLASSETAALAHSSKIEKLFDTIIRMITRDASTEAKNRIAEVLLDAERDGVHLGESHFRDLYNRASIAKGQLHRTHNWDELRGLGVTPQKPKEATIIKLSVNTELGSRPFEDTGVYVHSATCYPSGMTTVDVVRRETPLMKYFLSLAEVKKSGSTEPVVAVLIAENGLESVAARMAKQEKARLTFAAARRDERVSPDEKAAWREITRGEVQPKKPRIKALEHV